MTEHELHFSSPSDLHVCRSDDAAEEQEGVSVVIPQQLAESALEGGGPASMKVVPGGGWALHVEPDFDPECAHVRINGEFEGDARTVEKTSTGARLTWVRVPRDS